VTKTVLLCGYYGEHNLGDDALLAALLQQLPASTSALVTAFDRADVEARHDVATVQRRSPRDVLSALRRADALVFGGGSLLQDSTSFQSLLYYAALIAAARLQGKPVLLWAQGLGPLRRRRSRALVRALLPWLTAVTWRDADSATLATQLGAAKADHAVDAVWSLPREQWLGQGGAIVVCWRPTDWLAGERWSPYLQALAQLAEVHNREVLWVPFHREQDQTLLAALLAEGYVPEGLRQRSRQVEATSPREAMAVFRSAGLVIAMRLHALILGALSGAPVAALSYDPKVKACADQIGCPCADLASPHPSVEDLSQQWSSALDQPPGSSRLAELVAAAAQHRELLRHLED
jgi:polysaccharide pyruvyl transferase CsaB